MSMLRNCKKFYSAVNDIEIIDKSLDEIYNDSQTYLNRYSDDGSLLLESNIKRVLVNHIRHTSNFDYHKGIRQVQYISPKYKDQQYNYKQYKNIILNKIGETYPTLKDECERQKYEVSMVKIINK